MAVNSSSSENLQIYNVHLPLRLIVENEKLSFCTIVKDFDFFYKMAHYYCYFSLPGM